jgi:hypothetical protein
MNKKLTSRIFFSSLITGQGFQTPDSRHISSH